jgi:hypothetical protein
VLCSNRDSRNRKDAFYQLLNETLKKVKRRIKILMGDMNAQVGPENEGLEHVTGRHGIGNKTKMEKD